MPKVIIADDEDYIRDFLRVILESMNFEVVAEVGRGDKLPDIMAEQQPDILLLDINMPGMTGIEFLREYSPNHPKTCIIILTSLALATMINEKSLVGANCFLRKDTPTEEIIEAISTTWLQFVEENEI